MWNLIVMKFVTFILIPLIWTTEVSNAEQGCSSNSALPSWNFSKSSPPATVTQTFIKSTNKSDPSFDRIQLTVTNKTDDFCLGLVVLPHFKKDNQIEKPSCSPVLVPSFEIRECETVYYIKGARTTPQIKRYRRILTGCFYVILSKPNSNESWQLEPTFHSTDYPYYDDNVRLDSSSGPIGEWLKPEDSTNDRRLYFTLKGSLDCTEVTATLYEIKPDENPDAVMNLIKTTISYPISQRCKFVANNTGVVNCTATKSRTNITLDVTPLRNDGKSNGWAAMLKWKKLSRDRKKYILRFSGGYTHCDHFMIQDEVYDIRQRWQPIKISDGFICEYVGESQITVNGIVKNNWIMITTIVSSIGTVLGMLFFILKWFRLLKAIKLRKKYANTDILSSYSLLNSDHDERLSNRIMLLYVKDSAPFMAAMNDLRLKLKQACNCEVHDIFDDEECDRMAVNLASVWFDEHLKAGSKVVWVDTPQFRSKLRNPENFEKTASDFREAAICGAVTTATDMFQNSVTQYLRQFVVRIEGFEVKEKNDDPLLVVSPHTRYRIPQHFDQLCTDLTESLIAQTNLEDERNNENEHQC